jgi:hypothetical protein
MQQEVISCVLLNLSIPSAERWLSITLPLAQLMDRLRGISCSFCLPLRRAYPYSQAAELQDSARFSHSLITPSSRSSNQTLRETPLATRETTLTHRFPQYPLIHLHHHPLLPSVFSSSPSFIISALVSIGLMICWLSTLCLSSFPSKQSSYATNTNLGTPRQTATTSPRIGLKNTPRPMSPWTYLPVRVRRRGFAITRTVQRHSLTKLCLR